MPQTVQFRSIKFVKAVPPRIKAAERSHEGEECQQGWTQSRTGCTPKTGEGKESQRSSKDRAVLEITPVGVGTGRKPEFGPDFEVIEGRIGGLPITTRERGLIQKLSKKTKAMLEDAFSDPEIQQALKVGGIKNIRIEPTKRSGKPSSGWTAALTDFTLWLHPKTAEAIENSAVSEKRQFGFFRVVHHEVGHAVWDKSLNSDKAAFAAALKNNPSVIEQVSRIVNVAANPNAFSNTESREVTESFAELTAMRRYDKERYVALPDELKTPIESMYARAEKWAEEGGKSFGRNIKANRPHEGEPCKRGWTSKRTGCVPASGQAEGQSTPTEPVSSDPSAIGGQQEEGGERAERGSGAAGSGEGKPRSEKKFARKINLEGIDDPRVLERIHSTLSQIYSDYGIELESVTVDNLEEGDPDQASAAKMYMFGWGRYEHGEKIVKKQFHLVLNENTWKDVESLRLRISLVPDGFFADTSAVGMLRHEMAHALDNAYPEYRDIINSVFSTYEFHSVSKYSGTNPKEMVAEAFSHYLRQGSLEGTGLERLTQVFEGWKIKGSIGKKSMDNSLGVRYQESWKKTPAEYIAYIEKDRGGIKYSGVTGKPFQYESLSDRDIENIKREHRHEVRTAMANASVMGYIIPRKVIESYPDLASKYGIETVLKKELKSLSLPEVAGQEQPYKTDIPTQLIEIPDIRQRDTFSCGAAAAMSVGRWFNVGPETLEEWKAALHTTEKESTRPFNVASYLDSLGLHVEAKNNLTLDDLRDYCNRGMPIITPIQEYGVPSKQASAKYGHWVVVIGVNMGYVFVQDPSYDNILEQEQHPPTDGIPEELVNLAREFLKVPL